MDIKLSVLIPVWNQEELVIKALDHLPRRDDMEVIVRDDGSTDHTLANLIEYKEKHPELNLQVFANDRNRGVAYTKNQMLKVAKGEYIHIHDSDDYVYTKDYNEIVDTLDGKDDIVYMDLEINNGQYFTLGELTKAAYCAQTARFLRREFVKGLEFPESVTDGGDDRFYNDYCLSRDPVNRFTHIPAYHYNYPREGSLFDLMVKNR